MAKKAKDAFRTISEVADWLDVPAHVLRFWESKFPQIKPVKRAGGRRYYRPSDMRLIGGIKTLLHDQGITIRGVQLKLKEDGIDAVSALSQPVNSVTSTPKQKTIDAKADPKPVVEDPKEVDTPVQDTTSEQDDASEHDAAPFIEAPEDTTTGGDNVVPMSRRDIRRADLETQASEMKEDTTASEPAPEETVPEETTPEPETPAADPEPISETTPEPVADTPEPEPVVAATPVISTPDFSQVTASQTRRDSMDTISNLRRWDPTTAKNREQIQYLEHRVRTLRDRMADALNNT